MTTKLRNISSSTLPSYSIEHDSNAESKCSATDKPRRSRNDSMEETLKTRETRLPSSRDLNVADISIDESTASPPNVVEPDVPSPYSPSLDGAPVEGLKRQHSCNSSSSFRDNNEDCESVTSTYSLGTQSLNSRKPKRQHSMSVRFADPLITKIFTRAKTLPEDKYVLHYSFEEMDEFREEYYRFCEEQEEQILLDELANSSSSDDSSLLDGYPTDCSVLSDSSSAVDTHLIDDDVAEDDSSCKTGGSSKPSSRKHSISKVMVVHNDVTIVCPTSKKPIHPKSYFGEETSQESKKTPLVYTATNDDDDYSFDNPAFWNGSLTWY